MVVLIDYNVLLVPSVSNCCKKCNVADDFQSPTSCQTVEPMAHDSAVMADIVVSIRQLAYVTVFHAQRGVWVMTEFVIYYGKWVVSG